MHRTDGAGNVAGMYVAEDAAIGRPPTEVTPEQLNAFQEELAGLVEWAGLALDKADNTQLRQALLAKFAGLDSVVTKADVQAQTYTAFTTGGATGAFTLTPVPAITAYAAGQRFRAKFHANGNSADMIRVSGLGWLTLKQYDGNGAKVPAVIAVNQLSDVEYDGVDMVVMSAVPSVYSSVSEARAFAAANRVISPLMLEQAFKGEHQSLAGSGYQRLPGGLYIQWGGVAFPLGITAVPVIFPIAFPNSLIQIVLSQSDAASVIMGRSGATRFGFTAMASVAGYNSSYFAIGY